MKGDWKLTVCLDGKCVCYFKYEPMSEPKDICDKKLWTSIFLTSAKGCVYTTSSVLILITMWFYWMIRTFILHVMMYVGHILVDLYFFYTCTCYLFCCIKLVYKCIFGVHLIFLLLISPFNSLRDGWISLMPLSNMGLIWTWGSTHEWGDMHLWHRMELLSNISLVYPGQWHWSNLGSTNWQSSALPQD